MATIHLVFSSVPSRHRGAIRPGHRRRSLDEFVICCNRGKAEDLARSVAGLIQHAVGSPPTTHGGIVCGPPGRLQ